MSLKQLALLPLLAITLLATYSSFSVAGPSEERERVIRGLGSSLDESAAHYLRGNPGDGLPGVAGETTEVRIAQQYGLGYLPLMIARQNGLIEKAARRLGHTQLKVKWSRFPSGQAMNQALETGFLDIASGGIAPMIRGWDRNQRNLIQGLAALSSMPLLLNTSNPAVKSLADLTRRDRIALPSRDESTQAVLLRMAVAAEIGLQHQRALDGLAVSMPHPQAMNKLLAGTSISAHFASPPFQYQELQQSGVRTLINSYDLTDGPTTFTALWSRRQFATENPVTVRALLDALDEANRLIATEPRQAAQIYLLHSSTDLHLQSVVEILAKPALRFTLLPENTLEIARFMQESGDTRRLPADIKELFIDAGTVPIGDGS